MFTFLRILRGFFGCLVIVNCAGVVNILTALINHPNTGLSIWCMLIAQLFIFAGTYAVYYGFFRLINWLYSQAYPDAEPFLKNQIISL